MAELKDYIIGIILFSVIVVGFVTFMYDSGTSKYYNLDFNDEYAEIYEDINTTLGIGSGYELGINMSESLEESEGVTTSSTGWSVLAEGAKKALKTPIIAMKIIPNLITKVAVKIGIPSWLFTTIIALLIITLAFLLLSAFMRWKTG
jgi:hypothetical protein